MKKHKNVVNDHTESFTPRQWKHFLDHGPSWRHHYQKENRRRLRIAVLIGAAAIAAAVYISKHI